MSYYDYERGYGYEQGPSGILGWILAIVMFPFALMLNLISFAFQWFVVLLIIGIPIAVIGAVIGAVGGS